MLLSISSILSAQSDSLRDISFLRRPNPDANIQHAEADSFFKNFLKHFIITLLNNNDIIYRVANSADTSYSETIAAEMASSAAARGTGIAVRTPEYLSIKMQEGKSIIAVTTQGKWVGFCYIETWQHGEYVANSGLIVHPAFRKSGVAKQIKNEAFNLSRTKYPNAKLFGLTTGLAVIKINSDLGYEPVTYGELTQDDAFWPVVKAV